MVKTDAPLKLNEEQTKLELLEYLKIDAPERNIFRQGYFDRERSYAGKIIALKDDSSMSLLSFCMSKSNADIDEFWNNIWKKVFEKRSIDWGKVKDHKEIDTFIECLLNLEDYWQIYLRAQYLIGKRKKVRSVTNQLEKIKHELVSKCGYSEKKLEKIFAGINRKINEPFVILDSNNPAIEYLFPEARLYRLSPRRVCDRNNKSIFISNFFSEACREIFGKPHSRLVGDLVQALLGTSLTEQHVNIAYSRTRKETKKKKNESKI